MTNKEQYILESLYTSFDILIMKLSNNKNFRKNKESNKLADEVYQSIHELRKKYII